MKKNEKLEEAKKLYKSGNKLIDISKILGIAEGTIRSWKNRYNWDGESKKNNATLQKEDNKKRNVAKEKRNSKALPKDWG